MTCVWVRYVPLLGVLERCSNEQRCLGCYRRSMMVTTYRLSGTLKRGRGDRKEEEEEGLT